MLAEYKALIPSLPFKNLENVEHTYPSSMGRTTRRTGYECMSSIVHCFHRSW